MKCPRTIFIVFLLFVPGYTYAQHTDIHIVQKGETLYGLARKYQVRISDIKQWNKLQSEEINVGQRLRVTSGKSNFIPPLMDYTLSQEYANRIMYARVQVHNNCLFNVSGELEFYLKPNYGNNGTWRRGIKQFFTSASELDIYLQLFNELNTMLVKTTLKNEDRGKIVYLYRRILKFEYFRLAYAHAEGNYVNLQTYLQYQGVPLSDIPLTAKAMNYGSSSDPPPTYSTSSPDPTPTGTSPVVEPYSTSSPVLVKVNIIAIKSTDLSPLPDSQVYVLEKEHLNDPKCLRCLTSDNQNCDPVGMNITSVNLVKKLISPGFYHLVVTIRQDGMERIVVYEKRNIALTDEGKTITLPVPGY